MTPCSASEAVIDPECGYPRKFERICRGALRSRYIRYPRGPPTAFVSEIVTVNEEVDVTALEAQFPVIPESERASTATERFRDALWNQLDSLRGFDDSLIRIDKYGNVLFSGAEAGSPLYGQIDHWFPVARGGLSVLPNLASIYWEANKHKGDQLEFLVPWYDLQCGVHFTRFISTFASTDAVLRQRMFRLFFGDDLGAHHVVAAWVPPSLSRTAYISSAVVSMDAQGSSGRGPGAVRQIRKGDQRRSTKAWSTEETAALQEAVRKHSEPGQRSLPLHKCREILAAYSIFREARREPKDLYDKWRNLQNQQSKGGTPRRSVASASSPRPTPSSPAPSRRISIYSNENHSQARRLSWSQPPESRALVKGAAATCHSQNAPLGSPIVPRPPLSPRDQNTWSLEADFARTCALSDSSSDESEGGDELLTVDWRQGRDPSREAASRCIETVGRVQSRERPRAAAPQAFVPRTESLFGRGISRSTETSARKTVVDQTAGLAAQLQELEGRNEGLARESAAAAQRREDLLCEVALVEQEVREHARALEAQRAQNEALAASLRMAEGHRDAAVEEWARAGQKQREAASRIRELKEETVKKEGERWRVQGEIQRWEETRAGLVAQATHAGEALEEEQRGLRGVRHECARLKLDRDTLRKKIAACEEEKRALEARIKKLKEEREELEMQLDLDLPALRQWQIRAGDAEQQTSLAQQRAATFQHDLQTWAERGEKLEAEMAAAQTAAGDAEQCAREERECVAQLQGRLKEVRIERQRSREACEELRLKRGVLEERLREEELGWRESEAERERQKGAVETAADGLERVIRNKGGRETVRLTEEAIEDLGELGDGGTASDAGTEVLEAKGEEAEDCEEAVGEAECGVEGGGKKVVESAGATGGTCLAAGGNDGSGGGKEESNEVLGAQVEAEYATQQSQDVEHEEEADGTYLAGEVKRDAVTEDVAEHGRVTGEQGPNSPCETSSRISRAGSLSERRASPPELVHVLMDAGTGQTAGDDDAAPSRAGEKRQCSSERVSMDLALEASVSTYTSADGGSQDAATCDTASGDEAAIATPKGVSSFAARLDVGSAMAQGHDEQVAVESKVRSWLESFKSESEGVAAMAQNLEIWTERAALSK